MDGVTLKLTGVQQISTKIIKPNNRGDPLSPGSVYVPALSPASRDMLHSLELGKKHIGNKRFDLIEKQKSVLD